MKKRSFINEVLVLAQEEGEGGGGLRVGVLNSPLSVPVTHSWWFLTLSRFSTDAFFAFFLICPASCSLKNVVFPQFPSPFLPVPSPFSRLLPLLFQVPPPLLSVPTPFTPSSHLLSPISYPIYFPFPAPTSPRFHSLLCWFASSFFLPVPATDSWFPYCPLLLSPLSFLPVTAPFPLSTVKVGNLHYSFTKKQCHVLQFSPEYSP